MTVMPERPAPAVDTTAEAEIRAAARALLRMPMLYDGGGHDDELRLVRRHRAELTRLFAEGLGYRLVIQPGVVRLVKTGLGRDHSRGLRRRSGTPFSPRGYAMLNLTLAALTRCRAQLMVDELVAQVRSAAADAGIEVDLDAIADRRALAWGAAGPVRPRSVERARRRPRPLGGPADAQSLLDVRRDRLALLVAAPLGGRTGADDVVDVMAVPSAAGGARVAVRRRLAERPVLSLSDLTEEQREWWRRNRNREREWFRQRLGLELELRAEGAVAIDPDGELTDAVFPGGGSTRHFALLLLEAVVNELRATHGADSAGQEWVGDALGRRTTSRGRVVRDLARGTEEGASCRPGRVVRAGARSSLEGAGLVRVAADAVSFHAAGARFAARPELVAAGRSGERSLFDEEDV